jgi:hypothetical protein
MCSGLQFVTNNLKHASLQTKTKQSLISQMTLFTTRIEHEWKLLLEAAEIVLSDLTNQMV